ncbi:hypothetical protein WT83_05005 [Burkholderia territorii]|uniref:Uncharacterized protein n=1 Tax=Burkholderia territorii TaxID=1503055 RepID=A0A108F2S6_9BURK|nr:hypothetical protein WT83_05005 [Burkholderia territorii]
MTRHQVANGFVWRGTEHEGDAVVVYRFVQHMAGPRHGTIALLGNVIVRGKTIAQVLHHRLVAHQLVSDVAAGAVARRSGRMNGAVTVAYVAGAADARRQGPDLHAPHLMSPGAGVTQFQANAGQ